jgi:ribonuclease R
MNHTQKEGTISVNYKGSGYVRLSDPALKGVTIEIRHEDLNRAFHGDTVLVEYDALLLTPGIRQVGGKVISVLNRAKYGYAGKLQKGEGDQSEYYFLVPGDLRVYTDIVIPKDKLKGAHEGDKVFTVITSWEDPKKSPIGEVVKVLGRPGENNAEMCALCLEKGFEDGFPEVVVQAAKAIQARGITEADMEGRRDMRDRVTFTIDPYDAKDFDDAISVKKNEDETFEVGIHIADVSHYVTPESVLDAEAQKRQTSIYLVDRVIPMLPEELSNDLCSLNEHVDRLTMSAVFTFSKDFEVIDTWYGKTAIYSDKRFTYENAQEILDAKEGLHYEELEICRTIGKKLEHERFLNGALRIDQEEVKFKLDETGKPISVFIKTRGDTHHMIEELMLLANKYVAYHMTKEGTKEEKDLPFVYRIHDKPDQDRMNDLYSYLSKLGYSPVRDSDGIISSVYLNTVLAELEGSPAKDMIQTVITRSMAKAIYSTTNIGHYGLAFTYYTHFTSPIRRYPDVLAHRLLQMRIKHDLRPTNEKMILEKLCGHASEREKAAAEAERGSIKYKQVEYMAARIGEVFEGVVTGVSENGAFVEEAETKCEGMIRMKDLGPDFYGLEEKTLTIKGETHGEEITIGTRFKIKVISVDQEKNTIDYARIS